MQSYQNLLIAQLSTDFGQQLFNALLYLTFRPESDKSLVTFSESRRLIKLEENHFIYGSSEEVFQFTTPSDATHIYYESTSEPDVLTLPFILKLSSSNTFEVYTLTGWKQFDYPLEHTAVDLNSLYSI